MVAKFGVDTAENEPAKNLQNFANCLEFETRARKAGLPLASLAGLPLAGLRGRDVPLRGLGVLLELDGPVLRGGDVALEAGLRTRMNNIE